MISDKL